MYSGNVSAARKIARIRRVHSCMWLLFTTRIAEEPSMCSVFRTRNGILKKPFEKIESLLRRITEKNYQPGCTSRMEFLNRRPAMPSGKIKNGLIPILEDIGSRLDIPVRFEHRYGSSDANFFGASGVPTLDGFGPIGIRDHTSDERILIDSLIERTKLLSLLLSSLSPEGL